MPSGLTTHKKIIADDRKLNSQERVLAGKADNNTPTALYQA